MEILNILGLLIVIAAWLHYLNLIGKEKVPVHPIGHKLVMAGGSGAAIIGAPSLGVMGAIIAITAVGAAFFFLYLLREAPLPDGTPTFSVGEPLPAFSAIDGQGQTFSSENLANKRVLLKFFRGHW